MIKRHIGNIVPDLYLHNRPALYPVLNERAIRATAGLLFAIGLSTMRYTILTGDRSIMLVVVLVFLLHFMISSARGPVYSPIAWIGNTLVSGQSAEYVGAIQKRFARTLGAIMASVMVLLIYLAPESGVRPLVVCIACLILMRLESAVGLCVGCKLYYVFIKRGRIKNPEHRPVCPGGACERKEGK